MKNKILKFLSEAKNVAFAAALGFLTLAVLMSLLTFHWISYLIAGIAYVIVDCKAEEIAEACQYSLSIDDE